MPFLVKLSPEFSSSLLEEAKATLALSLFLLAAEEKAIIVHLTVQIRIDSSVLTASRTAGAAAVCKANDGAGRGGKSLPHDISNVTEQRVIDQLQLLQWRKKTG